MITFRGLRRSALNRAKLSLTTTLNKATVFITKGIPRFFVNAMLPARGIERPKKECLSNESVNEVVKDFGNESAKEVFEKSKGCRVMFKTEQGVLKMNSSHMTIYFKDGKWLSLSPYHLREALIEYCSKHTSPTNRISFEIPCESPPAWYLAMQG